MDEDRDREPLADYVEGNLSEADLRAFEERLSRDPELRAEAERLRKLAGLIERLPHERDVPPEVTARIRAAIEAEAAGPGRPAVAGPGAERRGPVLLRRLPLTWAAAAAVLLAAVLVWIFYRPASPPAPDGGQLARLTLGYRVGRAIPGAEYRVYAAGLERVYDTLNLMERKAAFSCNNLRVVTETAHQEVRADTQGRIALAELSPDEQRLTFVRKAGSIGAWGLVERAGESGPPAQASVLFPAREITISGRVVDATTATPIRDAWLASPDGSGVIRSGEDGRFRGVIRAMQEGSPRLLAFATGYAEAEIRPDDASVLAGAFTAEIRLAPELRVDAELEIVDPDGRPLAAAVVMAYADPAEGAPVVVPSLRLDRPEIGIADASGRVTLRQLLACRYRLEIHHDTGYFAAFAYDPMASPRRRVTVNPAGEGRLAFRAVEPDGEVLRSGRVVLALPAGRHEHLIETSAGPRGQVEFRQLQPGTVTIRVFDDDGYGYALTVRLPRDAVLGLDYRVPERLHTVSGRLAPEVAGRVRTVRLTGELEPVEVGGSRTEAHRLTVEVPVERDGEFRLPRLPRLVLARLEGRLTANPGRLEPLATDPPLASVVTAEQPQSVQLRVDAR